MQKTKTVRTYKRKTKSGKTVTVKQHTAKYDAAEAARKAFLKDSRAGSEYASIKDMPTHGISADDFKEWYHWDLDEDPQNEAALRVKEALTKKLGKKGYQEFEDKMTDSYTRRGHLSAFKKLEGMFKPKPNASYEHTTKLPRKHSAERPLSDRGAKNLEGIQGKGLKMPKGFKYNDEQHSDDYDSFVATDKRAINALKKQIAGKRWKKVEADDGSVHFHSPDKSVHVVVNDQRAAIFYRENPVTAKPKKEVAQAVPKGSVDSGKGYQKEYVAVRPFKSSYKPTGEDNIIKSVKVVSERGGYAPYGNGTGQIIIEGKAGSSKVFKTPEAAMRAVENLMISQGSPKKKEEEPRYGLSAMSADEYKGYAKRAESRARKDAGVTRSTKVPKAYQLSEKDLPRKKNRAGESTMQMSATKRAGLFKYLPMQGWKRTNYSKSKGNEFAIFEKGGRTIAINTGKDKFYEDVVIK